MSPVKQEAIRMIESLPDTVSLKDILYHIYVRERVEEGLRDLEAGEVLTLDELDREVSEWGRSSGQEPR